MADASPKSYQSISQDSASDLAGDKLKPSDNSDALRQRKLKHVEACLHYPVEYQTRSTGFEHITLPYCALPETSLEHINTQTGFLGKTLRAPILIGAMTGGAALSATINRNLATAAQHLGIGLMLGSQRVMLEHPEAQASFAVRAQAPDILLIGNLGIAQLNRGYGSEQLRQAIESIGADGLALHCNPLQEALQAGGDGDFRNILATLPALTQALPYPLLLKEVGHGLRGTLAQQLEHSGLAALDVAGAGGTSWARVEQLVRYGEVRHPELAEWGIPTAQALQEVRAALPSMPLIASGGIRSGMDAAKALALGAQVVAIARPLLAPATRSAEEVIAWLEDFLWQLRVCMHCSGAADLGSLQRLSCEYTLSLPM